MQPDDCASPWHFNPNLLMLSGRTLTSLPSMVQNRLRIGKPASWFADQLSTFRISLTIPALIADHILSIKLLQNLSEDSVVSPSHAGRGVLHHKVSASFPLVLTNAFHQTQSLQANGLAKMFPITSRTYVVEQRPEPAVKRNEHTNRVVLVQHSKKKPLTGR